LEQDPANALQHHDSATSQLTGIGTSFLYRQQVAADGAILPEEFTMEGTASSKDEEFGWGSARPHPS